MSIQNYRFLLSERATLNKLIRKTTPDEVITRKSFENRLLDVEAEIKAYEAQPAVAHVSLADDGLNEICRGCKRQFNDGALAKVMTAPPAYLCLHCVSDRYERGDLRDEVEIIVSPLMIQKSIFAMEELISPILALKPKEDRAG